jgi:HlyD family secretion protein
VVCQELGRVSPQYNYLTEQIKIKPSAQLNHALQMYFDILGIMKNILLRKGTLLTIIVSALIGVIGFYYLTANTTNQDWVTTTVERGDVQDIVSVSGFVEAKNTAGLSFPVVGIVTDVFTEEGAEVMKGNLLATLGSANLLAQRTDAVATLQKALAVRDELLTGPTTEARAVTDITVASAESSLEKIITTEAEKVASARSGLLSNDIVARAIDSTERDTVPTVSGAYTCEEEGQYSLSLYSSGAQSGFSYTLTGLESDTENGSARQPSPLGDCGLLIQFTEGESYANSEWVITVPNTKSSTYVTYKNAYDLALQQEEQRVQAAKDAFALATSNATYANAAPSSAAVQQANASIASAQAGVTQIEVQIKDLSIVAPFDGVITNVDVRPGETAGATPVITILAQDAFELKARIPEIDITKIKTGQSASVVFDAQSNQTLTGTLTFISPLATEIDGVAYFETTIVLSEIPQWMRSGLNADIDIIVAEAIDVLRIPKRFLIQNEGGTYSVLTVQKDALFPKPVELTSSGNNGYAAVTGLNEGDTIIAP